MDGMVMIDRSELRRQGSDSQGSKHKLDRSIKNQTFWYQAENYGGIKNEERFAELEMVSLVLSRFAKHGACEI